MPTSKMGGTHTITVKPQHRDHHRGLRTVSILEAAKGVLVLLAAFGFAEIIRHNIDLEDAAQNLLYFLHVDPDRRLSHALMHAADRVMDADLLTVLGIALIYSTLRFIESYGLWRQRVWAEWLAIVSGAVYLPFELYKLIEHPNMIHWAILLINICVVVYIAWVRWDEVKGRASRHPASAHFVEHGD
jgi:uncharacterized membrane protein (DUF2068 family)